MAKTSWIAFPLACCCASVVAAQDVPQVTPTPTAAAAPAATSAEEAASQPPEPEWPVLALHARLMTGFEVQREHPAGGQPASDGTQAEFFLEQAVIEADAEISKRIHLELGYNLRSQTIRDAFVNYRVHDAFQLRVGRFKRPFSRLELRSRGKLPFRDRGLFNDLVLSEGGFTGRALAGMIWGKPNDQLRYFLSGGSPAEIGSGIEGLDVIARVVYAPTPAVSIGAHGMHKWSERLADGDSLSLSAFGVDTRLEAGPFEITLEFDAAQNPNPPPVAARTDPTRTPWALGFIGYAEYTLKLSKKWTIAPVIVFEWLDTDTDYSRDERVRAVGGLSWNYLENALRILPQIEIIRPLGGADVRGEVASETLYLLVSAEI